MSAKKFATVLLLLTVFALVLTACAGEKDQPISDSTQVESYGSLLEALQEKSLAVEEVGPLSQPFFEPEGKAIKIAGEDVQIFEFESQEALLSAAETISEDGSAIGTSMVTWIAPPHFFKSEKIIVLYIGESETLLETLEDLLGPQIAGS